MDEVNGIDFSNRINDAIILFLGLKLTGYSKEQTLQIIKDIRSCFDIEKINEPTLVKLNFALHGLQLGDYSEREVKNIFNAIE